MKKINLFGLLLLLFTSAAIAATSPVKFLDNTASQVINALSRKKATIRSNPSAVYSIVNRYLVPKVDVYGMSRSVLGRNAWNKATSAQKRRFSRAFTKLVVRTYGGALAQYTNERVQFYPVRGGYAGKRRVQVNSRVIRSNGPSIPISYRVVRAGSGWRIYDMSVEGVSLLQSFRSQFAAQLRRGSLDDLIKTVEKEKSLMVSHSAVINLNSNQGFALTGDLTFQTITSVWQQGCDHIANGPSSMQVDLSGVIRCDSAGVAMILDWLRAAQKRGKDLVLVQIPQQMQAIVKVSGLTQLFPAQS